MSTKQTIVLASGNRGKLKEFNELFAGLGLTFVPQSDFQVPEIEETGLSFVENAILKARNAAQHSGLPALADDSGLAVDCLGGAPGIYSARYAGNGATDALNNAKLLEALRNYPAPEQRRARFLCLLVLMRHADDPTPLICQGSWEGQIGTAAQGENGFGYDPLFLDPELGLHAAQLSPQQKGQRSHRGRATAMLRQALEQGYLDR